uniref:Secreted protein n=1 Tax=Panagrolaimus sp. JU765 TaxID=591449 RepID=A0AC34R1P8_9BILA
MMTYLVLLLAAAFNSTGAMWPFDPSVFEPSNRGIIIFVVIILLVIGMLWYFCWPKKEEEVEEDTDQDLPRTSDREMKAARRGSHGPDGNTFSDRTPEGNRDLATKSNNRKQELKRRKNGNGSAGNSTGPIDNSTIAAD